MHNTTCAAVCNIMLSVPVSLYWLDMSVHVLIKQSQQQQVQSKDSERKQSVCVYSQCFVLHEPVGMV